MSTTLTFDDAAACLPEASRGRATTTALITHGAEFLAVRLGGASLGIDLRRVQEVRAFEPPARVAHAGTGVLGVLHLRGDRIPVVDLRAHLRLPERHRDADTVTVVLAAAGRAIGVVVDGVSDVVTVSPQQVRPAGQATAPLEPHVVLAVGTLADRTLPLVDVDALLADAAPGLA